MTDREERLRDYINASVDKTVVWGKSDCCSWPAQWATQESGFLVDLPKYASLEQARELIKRAGGLDKLAAKALANFPITDDPQLGDIGIIRLSDRDVGVIFCTNGTAVWRAEGGTIFIHPKTVLASWSV